MFPTAAGAAVAQAAVGERVGGYGAAGSAWAASTPPGSPRQFARARFVPAAPAPDVAAFGVWKAEVEARLDAQATNLTTLGLDLQNLVGRAEAALGAIVNGVAGELTAFKRQVHVDHGKLDALVVHLQQKFLAADGIVQELAAGTAAKFAAVDADAGRASHMGQRLAEAEQRIDVLMARFMEPPGAGSPLGTPPASPRPSAGSGAPARWMQHAGTDP